MNVLQQRCAVLLLLEKEGYLSMAMMADMVKGIARSKNTEESKLWGIIEELRPQMNYECSCLYVELK